jgi:hypothetical protein
MATLPLAGWNGWIPLPDHQHGCPKPRKCPSRGLDLPDYLIDRVARRQDACGQRTSCPTHCKRNWHEFCIWLMHQIDYMVNCRLLEVGNCISFVLLLERRIHKEAKLLLSRSPVALTNNAAGGD